MPVAFGHTAITAGWDLVAWLALSLFVVRAVLREEPRWWLAAAAVLGAATWNKLLIPMLVASILAGFLVAGPRRLPWRYVLGGAGPAVVIAAPQVLYQAAVPPRQLIRSLRGQPAQAPVLHGTSDRRSLAVTVDDAPCCRFDGNTAVTWINVL